MNKCSNASGEPKNSKTFFLYILVQSAWDYSSSYGEFNRKRLPNQTVCRDDVSLKINQKLKSFFWNFHEGHSVQKIEAGKHLDCAFFYYNIE